MNHQLLHRETVGVLLLLNTRVRVFLLELSAGAKDVETRCVIVC